MRMPGFLTAVRQWTNRTTQRRLIIGSTAFWVFSLVALILVFLLVGQNRMVQETSRRNVQLASVISRDVNAELSGIYSNTRFFVQHLEVSSPDLATQASAMVGLRLSSPWCRAIHYFDTNGTPLLQITDTTQSLMALQNINEIVTRAPAPVTEEVMNAFYSTVVNRAYVSGATYTSLERTPVLYIGMPASFPWNLTRFIIFEIDLSDIWQRINIVTVGQTGITYLISKDGTIIAHPEPAFIGRQAREQVAPVLASYEGYANYSDPIKGREVIAAYSPVGGPTGWGIVVEQEEAEANAAIIRAGLIMMGIWLALGLAGTAGIFFLVSNFTRPIKRLTRTVQDIAQTGFLAKTGMIQRPDEVGQLSQSFDLMIDHLRDTEGKLTSSEERYRSLYEHANDAIVLIDESGIVDCNRKMEIMFGTSRDALLRKFPADISPPQQPDGEDTRRRQTELVNRGFAGEAQVFEWRHVRANGELFDTEVCLNRLTLQDKVLLMGIIRDITDRKRAEEALRHAFDELETRVQERTSELRDANQSLRREITQRQEAEYLLRQSEERYRDLVENAASIILEMDTRGNVTFINRYAQEFFGYSANEILGRNVVGTIVPEVDSAGRNLAPRIADILAAPEFYENHENENMKRNGDRVWIAWTNRAIYDRDGKLKEVHSIGLDRTAQVKAAATQELKTKEEATAAERTRLARELHDAVSQTLFSASIIADVLPRIWDRNQEEGRRRLEEIRQLTRGALAEMRTLLVDLRPAALVDVSMQDLLKQLTESVMGRARIPVDLEVTGDCDLPPDVKVSLYRIAQEALNNISKHARAKRAGITVACSRDTVEMTIADNGVGFDAASTRPGSLGLGIMKDRARSFGATLTIHSEPGRGTWVKVLWQDADEKETE